MLLSVINTLTKSHINLKSSYQVLLTPLPPPQAIYIQTGVAKYALDMIYESNKVCMTAAAAMAMGLSKKE